MIVKKGTAKAKASKAPKKATPPAKHESQEVTVHRERWAPYANLESIGVFRLDYIRAQLLKGIPPRACARTIKADWGLLEEVSMDALTDLLKTWRDKHVVPSMNGALWDASGGKIEDVMSKLDVMDEMVELCLVQKERLTKARVIENAGGIPSDLVTGEVALYSKMLKELAATQIEVGILRRAPKHVTGSLTVRPGAGAGGDRRVSFHWDEQMEEELDSIRAEYEVIDSKHRPKNGSVATAEPD